LSSLGGEVYSSRPFTVEAVSASGSVLSTTPDPTGHFVFPNIQPGTYTLIFRLTNGVVAETLSIEAHANDVPAVWLSL